MGTDTYKTIKNIPEPQVFKDKKSRFVGYAFPVNNIDKVKEYVIKLKKDHHSARHWCYAYRIGIEEIKERANDDGEPSNSAGMPILNQIKSNELTNVLVVVVRYFGGIKLGVGGLINAYKTTSQMILNEAKTIEKIRKKNIIINLRYEDLSKIMRIIKEYKLEIIEQKMQEKIEYTISVRLDDYENVKNILSKIYTIRVK